MKLKRISKKVASKQYGVLVTGANSMYSYYLREDGCVVDSDGDIRYYPPDYLSEKSKKAFMVQPVRCNSCDHVFLREEDLIKVVETLYQSGDVEYRAYDNKELKNTDECREEVINACTVCLTDNFLTDLPDCIVLDTFPDDDKDYQKKFVAEKNWLFETIQTLDSFNERKGTTLENFLYNYVWEETEVIYDLAKRQGKLVKEWHE